MKFCSLYVYLRDIGNEILKWTQIVKNYKEPVRQVKMGSVFKGNEINHNQMLKSQIFKFFLIGNVVSYCFLSLFRYNSVKTLKTRLQKFQEKSNIRFHVDSIEFEKINIILIRNLIINFAAQSLNIRTIMISLRMSKPLGWKFIHFSYVLVNVKLEINHSQDKKPKNQFRSHRTRRTHVNAMNFYKIIFRLISLFKIWFFGEGKVQKLSIYLNYNRKKNNYFLNEISIKNNQIRISYRNFRTSSREVSLLGSFTVNTKTVFVKNIRFISESERFINHNNIRIGFESLNIKITTATRNSASIYVSFSNGKFFIPQLHKGEVVISDLKGCFNIKMNENNFEIKDSTYIKFNKLKLNFFFLHEFPKDIVQVEILSDSFTVEQLLQQFDSFNYKPIYNLKFIGEIIFLKFTFFINLHQPWRNIVELEAKENLELVSFGDDWKDLSSSFIHTVKKEGVFVRNIKINSRNKDFAFLKDIDPILIHTILYAEDPHFFKHNGIDENFIGYAIVENLTKNRFARGASTLTMQTVRNLFLSHEKTISRKFEEIILALLIENLFNVSKKNILEIYLNIIEFGHDIYGVREACDYYFNKKPSQVTAKESIVLSYIIPRPQFFMDAFENSSSQLRINLSNHINMISTKLLNEKLINKQQAKEMWEPISIRGKMLELEQQIPNNP